MEEHAAVADRANRERIEALYERSRSHFPEVDEITAEELLERRAAGEELLLVDVREPAEQAVSRIAGAVPRVEFERRADKWAGRTVVTYCTLGHRSGLYARQLRARGWQVLNLRGSILAWTHAGGPLVDGGEAPTRRVHVYGPRWSLAAAAYEPVW